MNYYVVVEGKCGEKRVYPKWISMVSPSLREVYSLPEINENTFYVISGNGYPNYFNIIDKAIEDCIANPAVDYLVIAVDAEDSSYEEKRAEVAAFVGNRLPESRVKIIIQFPCFESWALGNRVVCRRYPNDVRLRRYIRVYDVRQQDPEGLPPLPEEDLNRCQFAFVYLKRMLNDRYPGLTYTKNNPVVIEHEKYFGQIKLRRTETEQIRSFGDFLGAFEGS